MIQTVHKNWMKRIRIIYKAGQLLTPKSLVTLYYSFLYPYLNYCVTVWGNTNPTYLQAIVRTQKRAVRVICKKERKAETGPLFNELKFLTLKQLYLYSVQIFMYKFHHSRLPSIFNDFFKYNHQIHGYRTRQLHQLHVPKRKTKHRAKMIRFTGVQVSNYFDRVLSVDCSIPTYKKHIKTYILLSIDNVLKIDT